MKVLKKEVGKPYQKITIKKEEDIKSVVGEDIKSVPFGNASILCDAQGLKNKKHFNTSIGGIEFVGNIIILGNKSGHYCNLGQADIIADLLNASLIWR